MTEHQKYQLVTSIGDIEIRKYPPYVTADVLVEGDYERASNQGFRPLANYIFSNGISMTAPVIVEAENPETWRVSFVMPQGSDLDEMPSPNGEVALRSEAAEFCAAIRFRGYTSAKRVENYSSALMEGLSKAGISPIGNVRIARFDPPWKPGLLRHNEMIVPIKYQG